MAARKKPAKAARRPPQTSAAATGQKTWLALGRTKEDGQASFPIAPTTASMPEGYSLTSSELRQRIEEARLEYVCAFAAPWPDPTIVQRALPKWHRDNVDTNSKKPRRIRQGFMPTGNPQSRSERSVPTHPPQALEAPCVNPT